MFNIGDKVVYPLQGAGTIESIEEKEVLGNKNKYYIMKLSLGDMSLMIPINKIDELGIRLVVDKKQAEKVVEILAEDYSIMSKAWTKRYRENESVIKSGDIYGIAVIVRNLVILDRLKKLSTGEKKILINAKNILISELMLALDLDKESTDKLIESTVK